MSEPAQSYHFSPASDDAVNFDALLKKLDRDFAGVPQGLVERFNFAFDGLNFAVRRIAQKERHRFLVTAEMGYLPFTVESAERREAIRAIIMASRTLPTVRFSVDTTSRITAGALFDVKELIAPDFIFFPLVLFLQEARPFIALIGHYLSPAATAPKQAANTEKTAPEPATKLA